MEPEWLWFDMIETDGIEDGIIYCVSFSGDEEPRHVVQVGPYQVGLHDVVKVVNAGEPRQP